jgi:hypothetical protein
MGMYFLESHISLANLSLGASRGFRGFGLIADFETLEEDALFWWFFLRFFRFCFLAASVEFVG